MLMSIKEASEYLHVAQGTLRRWEQEGLLTPTRTTGGHRRYSEDDLLSILSKKNMISNDNRYTIGYCRVSTSAQKDDLQRQVECVSNYCVAKGYQFKIITDIGSGLNYKKTGFNKLIELICTGQINRIVLNYKDRLVRNGFELIEKVCRMHNVEIEIINLSEDNNQNELVEDVLAIITVYSAKLYGSRSHKNKVINETNKKLFEGDTYE